MQSGKKERIKKWIRSNWLNTLLLAVLAIIVFNPDAKAWVIKGLMQIGLMRPGIPSEAADSNTYKMASDAVFANAQGEQVHIATQKGKVIFINFWATWCPPCIAEMGSVNKLHESFKNNSAVTFILADADGNFSTAQAFMNSHQYNLPVYAAQQAGTDLYAGTLPTTIVINKKGQIVFREEGAANYDTEAFHNFINKLAEE